jgi:hypothetical protein
LSVATSIPASIAGQAYGVAKNLTSGKYGTKQGLDIADKAADEVTRKFTYAPRTSSGREDIEALGRAFDTSRLAGLPIEGPMLARAPEIPRMAITSGEGVGAAGRAVGQAVGRAVEPVAQAAGRGANAVGQAAVRGAARALPEVDPETLQLARAGHSMGFRLRPDQLYENKFGKIGGQLLSDVPLSGETTSANQRVFNRQLLGLIGGEGEKLTRGAYAEAMNRAGATIGRAFDAHNVPLDSAFLGRLRSAGGNALPEVRSVVNGYVDDLEKLAGPRQKLTGGGATARAPMVPGKALRPLLTRIKDQARSTSNGDLRHALIDLKDEIEESILPQLLPEERNEYQAALKRYAIGSTIQPLVAKSPGGNISPRALMGAVTSNAFGKRMMAMGKGGDLGQLADIGSLFLREPGTSNTTERGIVAGLLGGAGLGLNPAAAAVPWATANLYNRIGPQITEQILSRPPSP